MCRRQTHERRLVLSCDAGFQLIWAKVSDIIAMKMAVLATLVIFIFRWVQGIGACDMFSFAQLLFFELVPPRKWPLYVSLVFYHGEEVAKRERNLAAQRVTR